MYVYALVVTAVVTQGNTYIQVESCWIRLVFGCLVVSWFSSPRNSSKLLLGWILANGKFPDEIRKFFLIPYIFYLFFLLWKTLLSKSHCAGEGLVLAGASNVEILWHSVWSDVPVVWTRDLTVLPGWCTHAVARFGQGEAISTQRTSTWSTSRRDVDFVACKLPLWVNRCNIRVHLQG